MSLSIIILDDDAIQTNMFNNVLRHHYTGQDINLTFLTDGDEAISMIENNSGHTNLLITDINHPGVNGLELAHLCKKKYPHVIVLIQTAFAGDEYLEEARKYADFVLQKPYKIGDLTRIIDKILDRAGGIS